MSIAEIEVKQWGNSLGCIIPKDIVEHEGINKGDIIKIDIIKNKRIDGFGLFKGKPRFEEEEEGHKELWK